MGAVMCAWKSSPTAMGRRGATARMRRSSSPSPSSTCSATMAPCSARNAASQPSRIAPTMAVAHVLVGGPLDGAGRVGAGGERHDDLGARLARDVQEPAELGIGVLELGDGGGTVERPKGRERGRHRRERIGLVHHHRDHDAAAGAHGRPPCGARGEPCCSARRPSASRVICSCAVCRMFSSRVPRRPGRGRRIDLHIASTRVSRRRPARGAGVTRRAAPLVS